MPLNMGYVPVSIELCEGRVTGTTAKARSKRDSIRGQAVDVGRFDLLVSVAANMIGAQSINRD